MRIARVVTRLNLGGPARQVLASDPRLVQRGHEVRVFSGAPEPGEGDLFAAACERGIDVVRVPGLARGVHPAGDWRALRFLRREIAAFAPHIVHSHASKAGALGRRAARAVPAAGRVHTFHGHVLEGYFAPAVSRFLVAQERRLAVQTDRIVAVSHATGEDLVRLGVCEEERIVVVPPGVELDELLAIERPQPRAPGASRLGLAVGADDVLVGVVGRLAEVKRPELALAVFGLLAERHPQLHLVYVGDGDRRADLERRIAELDPSPRARVHVLGARTQMRDVLAALDVVLGTSRAEGLPVALIEAAAAGLPVVATAVGGVPEIVAHERTGFLGGDADELAFGLARLIEDGELRAACGHRARLRVRHRYGAAALADRLEALYRAVLEERRCAS